MPEARNARHRRGPARYAFSQCQAEFESVRRFFEIATRQGLRVPEDSQSLRNTLDDWDQLFHGGSAFFYKRTEFAPFTWPPVDIFALLSLSQHFGIPTRALDWTWDALTAAYFAVDVERLDREDEDELCVWVTDIERLQRAQNGGRREAAIVTFSASGADNDNLRAQRGLFMLHRLHVAEYEQRFVPKSYDELLADDIGPEAAGVFTRVTLAARHSKELLAALAAAGVTGASIYPGFWGVAREFHEQRRTWHVKPLPPKNDDPS